MVLHPRHPVVLDADELEAVLQLVVGALLHFGGHAADVTIEVDVELAAREGLDDPIVVDVGHALGGELLLLAVGILGKDGVGGHRQPDEAGAAVAVSVDVVEILDDVECARVHEHQVDAEVGGAFDVERVARGKVALEVAAHHEHEGLV